MNFRFALLRICLNMSLNLPTTRKDTADAPLFLFLFLFTSDDQWLTTEKSKQQKDDKMSHIHSEDWTNVNARSSLPFERNHVNKGFGVPFAEQSNLVPRLL